MAVGNLALKIAMFWLFSLIILLNFGCSPSPSPRIGQVDGNSMEPNFSGDRLPFQCTNCGLASYFSPPPPTDETVNCPRCAGTIHPSQQLQGDWIEIEPIGNDPLRIGDAIVFGPVSDSDANVDLGLQIKRIAGLPGQSIIIQDGDLWIDGKRHVGTTSQFLSTAILVDQASVEFLPQNSERKRITYTPSSLYPRRGLQLVRHASVLLDESPWDLNESREFVTVHDFAIEIIFPTELHIAKFSRLAILMRHKENLFSIDFTAEPNSNRIAIAVNGKSIRTLELDSAEFDLSNPILVAVIDGTLRIVLGSELMMLELDSLLASDTRRNINRIDRKDNSNSDRFGFDWDVAEPALDGLALFSLHVESAELTQLQIRLLRDIHYRGPRGENFFELPAGHGFHVLGDHVAASLDSRQRYSKGIPIAAILGRAKRKTIDSSDRRQQQ